MVADNVLGLVQQLETQHRLCPFVKQQPGDDFAAVGDEFGLLVVAKNGRNWYPTNIAAKNNFTRIVISRKEEKGQIEIVYPEPQ